MRKGDKQETASGVFRIYKYAFLIFEKGINKKLCFLGFVNMLFLIFEKGMSKKIQPGFLEFVSMLFLIFGKGMSKKLR